MKINLHLIQDSKKKNIPAFFFSWLILFFIACGTTGKLNHEDFSAEYSSVKNILNPDLQVFHLDSSKSELLIHIPDGAALYMRDSDVFVSRILIRYELYTNYNSRAVIDSGSKLIVRSSVSESDEINDTLIFHLSKGAKCIMRISIRDLNRKNEFKKLIELTKVNEFSRQNFLLMDENSNVQYSNYILHDEHFKLWSAENINKRFYVRCYFKKYPLAIPPFKLNNVQIFNYKADSIFTVDEDSIPVLKLNRYGFYHFQNDTLSKDGFTVYQYNSDFPLITNPEELVEPTRYLTTNNEFKELIAAKDKKEAIDKFWLNMGGNKEKARDLIRIYYGRVQRANADYSSYTEGWKTDRGLIYIIFGAPSAVYKDDEFENWNYNNQKYLPDITFVFKRMSNPFTDNDYNLIRQPTYETPYYLAVDQWRQGRIANDK